MPSEHLLKQLHEHFRSPIITRQDFRDFLGISVSTDRRMLIGGQYPELVHLAGGTQNARMTLESLAAWLENGGCRKKTEPSPPKRGRPIGSRNKPKDVAKEIQRYEESNQMAERSESDQCCDGSDEIEEPACGMSM